MAMSLVGIVFGIAFFIVTQAQTSGFEVFFVRTILGTNGAVRVSDRFQDMEGTVSKASGDQGERFFFQSRGKCPLRRRNCISQTGKSRTPQIPRSLRYFRGPRGTAVLDSGSRKHAVQVHGRRIKDHAMVSELENQLVQGSIATLASDRTGVLLGSRVAERLGLELW